MNALRRRLQLALVAAHRYGTARAHTEEQQAYAAQVMSGLTAILEIQPPAESNYPTRPVRKSNRVQQTQDTLAEITKR